MGCMGHRGVESKGHRGTGMVGGMGMGMGMGTGKGRGAGRGMDRETGMGKAMGMYCTSRFQRQRSCKCGSIVGRPVGIRW